MEALIRFRCWTFTLKFYDTKQIRSLNLGNIFYAKHHLGECFSHIPDAAQILERYYSMKNAEMIYKQSLLNEFFSECFEKNENVSQLTITQKRVITETPVNLLQDSNLVSNVNSITDRLLSFLEPFPFDRDEILNRKKRKGVNLNFIRNVIEKNYLAWKYQVNLDEIQNIVLRFRCSFYRSRSLSNLKRIILLLETVPDIQKRSVAEKIYHMNQKPFDLNNVLTFQEKVAGVIWHVFPQHCPKLLCYSHQYILFLASVLELLNFTEKQIQLGLPFLHFDFLTLIRKINELLENPKTVGFRHEPEFLQLIFLKSGFLTSMENSNTHSFEELLELINISRNDTRKRITSEKSVHYLISQFYEVERSQLFKIRYCPHYKFVSEMQLHETLVFLKEFGFTWNEIEESIAIIFYPRDVIVKTLEKIKKEKENLEKLGFGEDYSVEENFFANGTKEKRKLLQLCLYYIEKPFHFSGNGVWFTKEPLLPVSKS